MRLWRIEDSEGRGPFRPGLSVQWRDGEGNDFKAPWQEAGLSVAEFQNLFSSRSAKRGVACRSREQLQEWFSRSERRRLKRLGFREVEIDGADVLLETPTQVVFEVPLPSPPQPC